jgi:putative transposase
MPDHVHLLVEVHPAVSVAWLVKQVKGASSHFVTHVLGVEPTFGWQAGYGAFSLRRADVAIVKAYVLGQARHHTSGAVEASLESMPTTR